MTAEQMLLWDDPYTEGFQAGMQTAYQIASDRADDMRGCTKNDDCQVKSDGAQLVADDIEYWAAHP